MSSERRDEKRGKLLDAAKQVVQRFGYKKTTLEDVAEAAGVSRASLYYYFPNREAIFRALIAHEIQTLAEVVGRAIDPDDPPDERLMSLIRARHQQLKQIKVLYSVTTDIGRDLLPMAEDLIEQVVDAERAMVEGLIREGIASGRFREVDAPALAAAICAAQRGIEEQLVFEDRAALTEGAQCLFESMLEGIRT